MSFFKEVSSPPPLLLGPMGLASWVGQKDTFFMPILKEGCCHTTTILLVKRVVEKRSMDLKALWNPK